MFAISNSFFFLPRKSTKRKDVNEYKGRTSKPNQKLAFILSKKPSFHLSSQRVLITLHAPSTRFNTLQTDETTVEDVLSVR